LLRRLLRKSKRRRVVFSPPPPKIGTAFQLGSEQREVVRLLYVATRHQVKALADC
jgi:hypothetical protein